MARIRRLRVAGEIVFESEGAQSRGSLRDLSLDGAGARNVDPPLCAGSCVDLTMTIGSQRISPIRADVIWADKDALGLRFTSIDPLERAKIIQVASSLLS